MNILKKIIHRFKRPLPYFIDSDKSPELIVLCPNRGRPCGGVKVLYRQSSLLNELLAKHSHSSYIIHPKQLSFECSWFTHQTQIKHSAGLSARDIVVIPEVMVSKHAPALYALGIPYCIYVQNGYLMVKGDLSELQTHYHHAQLILAISTDSAKCIRTIFPDINNEKILRVHYSINTKLFRPNPVKSNTITYMPRKLAKHTQLVESFLKYNLPSHWQLVPVNNKSETETAALLASSKIFLSFSEFEGCPLPPLEAALCGNYVVGYTGEGGKEYFNLPAFTEINMGDIRHFCHEIMRLVEICDHAEPPNDIPEDIRTSIEYINQTYSEEMELNDMRAVIEHLKLLPVSAAK